MKIEYIIPKEFHDRKMKEWVKKIEENKGGNMRLLTGEEVKIYKRKLKECDIGDYEQDHVKADNILCSILKVMGYSDIVRIYKKVHKWYS